MDGLHQMNRYYKHFGYNFSSDNLHIINIIPSHIEGSYDIQLLIITVGGLSISILELLSILFKYCSDLHSEVIVNFKHITVGFCLTYLLSGLYVWLAVLLFKNGINSNLYLIIAYGIQSLTVLLLLPLSLINCYIIFFICGKH